MKNFLLATLIFSSVFADYKDTESLYHDTSKSVHQSISLHNVKAEPAEIITTTEIRRVPRYEYYNVYKTRTVWKCLPNGGGGGTTPTPPPVVVKIKWSTTRVTTYNNGRQRISGDAYSRGWTKSRNRVCGPCGACRSVSWGGYNGWNTMCGVRTGTSATRVFYIGGGSY